jgi:hypothetical protein
MLIPSGSFAEIQQDFTSKSGLCKTSGLLILSCLPLQLLKIKPSSQHLSVSLAHYVGLAIVNSPIERC